MSGNDILANALSTIQTAEENGNMTCEIPKSKVITQVLNVMQENGYIGTADEKEDVRARIAIGLSGQINKCGVIKPRYNVKMADFEKFEKRYLPAKNMGILLVSTQAGIITHHQAKEKAIGGRLIAYCY